MEIKQLQIVDFRQAIKLRKIGFDWKVDGAFHSNANSLAIGIDYDNHNAKYNVFSAPTVALALKWFRDVKGIKCGVQVYGSSNYWFYIGNSIIDNSILPSRKEGSETYELAESALLDELLNLIKTKNV